MIDSKLRAILRGLAEAATPGPWDACDWDPLERPHVYHTREAHNHGHDIARSMVAADAAFVAFVNPAMILGLLEALDAIDERYTMVVIGHARDSYPASAIEHIVYGDKLLPGEPC